MKSRKGFTLVELMVVVIIVSILAAVAIPMMQGRIDSAKWSEAKAGAGTIASAIRAYAAEHGTGVAAAPTWAQLGLRTTDLDGTYFTNAAYVVSGVSCNAAGQVAFTITVTAADSTRADKPTTPATMTLSQAAGAASVWN